MGPPALGTAAEFTFSLPVCHRAESSTADDVEVRRHLTRWLESLGEYIARHGWVDPTGAATPPPRLDADPVAGRPPWDDEDEPVLESTA